MKKKAEVTTTDKEYRILRTISSSGEMFYSPGDWIENLKRLWDGGLISTTSGGGQPMRVGISEEGKTFLKDAQKFVDGYKL